VPAPLVRRRHSTTVGMSSSLFVQHVHSADLLRPIADAVVALCDAAYETSTARYFELLGPGDHLLGLVDGELRSHLMWVTRWLQPAGGDLLRTAYVEMVATAPDAQRRGYASALLRHLVPLVQDYDVAALCPATEGIYERLGWRFWRGPLSARKGGGFVPTPDERVMVLPLTRTPHLDFDAAVSIEWRDGEIW
jgi:aminoglycoside 2'-N-acetyltransferase I